jgi:hypothetical protein
MPGLTCGLPLNYGKYVTTVSSVANLGQMVLQIVDHRAPLLVRTVVEIVEEEAVGDGQFQDGNPSKYDINNILLIFLTTHFWLMPSRTDSKFFKIDGIFSGLS